MKQASRKEVKKERLNTIKRKNVSILDGEKLGQRNRWKERDSGRK